MDSVLVRMHHLNIISDCLDNADDPRTGTLQKSLKKISKNKSGVVVLLRQLSEKIADNFFDENNLTKPQKILRNYGTGAQILVDLGIKNLTLLTNTKKSVIGLEAYGIRIRGYKKI